MKSRLIITALSLTLACILGPPRSASTQSPMPSSGKKPNILFIMGDDIGIWNLSTYHQGIVGYSTPNIDRLATQGAVNS
jgi:arylsulfatase